MVATKMGMLTPPGNMPMQPMAQPAPPMQAPMPPAMMTRNNAGRRRGFGDYLENMLDRPMMAADNMGDFDVFTGQPVVQMRGGGNVGDMYKKAYSSPAFKAYTASKKNTYAPNPTGTRKTHEEIMASIRGSSSRDDKPKPKPVVVEDPLDAFGGAGPDIASDPDYVSDGVGFRYDPITSSGTGTSGLPPIILDEINVVAPPDTSGSGMRFGDQPAAGLPQDPDFYDPRSGTGLSGFSDPRAAFTQGLDSFGGSGDPVNQGIASITDGVGGGRDPVMTPNQLNTSVKLDEGEEQGPQTIAEHAQNFMKQLFAMPGNVASDMQMAMDAGLLTGLFGGYEAMEKKLLEVKNPDGTLKYTPEQVADYIQRTKDKQALDKKNAALGKDDDDDSPVNPCQPGYVLDPATGICVPESEVAGAGSEDAGPNVSLNRARDDEFAELDDIMKIIEKPANMKAGGMAGLNRAADNFLSAMGK